MSKDQKRISATEKPVDNERYAFRCFLLRLGFIGDEYKTDRKILMRYLPGNSAFKGGEGHAISEVRNRWPASAAFIRAGTRVELVQMDHAQAPPVGTRGTVIGVDDTGSIMVDWDKRIGTLT